MFKARKARPVTPPTSNGAYASSDVARISGVSLRQLQWWDEQSVVSPRHDGHKRVYLPQEVIEVHTTYVGNGLRSVVQAAIDLRLGSSSAIAFLPAEPGIEPVAKVEAEWPTDSTVLYWWRASFWRRP